MALICNRKPPAWASAELSAAKPAVWFPKSRHPDAALAGLWLRFAEWDRAHTIAQDLPSVEGSYWHAILHRQEPDGWNSGYWFRRVRLHPVFKQLAEEARRQGGEPDPALFRYPGPKPQSLETAILMIANEVERATRRLPEPTTSGLRGLVDQIVLRGLSEFQFDQCGITQGQLRRVKEALASYLTEKLHRGAQQVD
jgi:hypothetical protein